MSRPKQMIHKPRKVPVVADLRLLSRSAEKKKAVKVDVVLWNEALAEMEVDLSILVPIDFIKYYL